MRYIYFNSYNKGLQKFKNWNLWWWKTERSILAENRDSLNWLSKMSYLYIDNRTIYDFKLIMLIENNFSIIVLDDYGKNIFSRDLEGAPFAVLVPSLGPRLVGHSWDEGKINDNNNYKHVTEKERKTKIRVFVTTHTHIQIRDEFVILVGCWLPDCSYFIRIYTYLT